MHGLDLGLYSHLKEYGGNGVRTNADSKGKVPSTGKILFRGGLNPIRCIKQDSEPNTLPTSYSGPHFTYLIPPYKVNGEAYRGKKMFIYILEHV